MSIVDDAKIVAKALLPPVVVDLANALRPTGCVWSGDYRSWSEAAAASTGYDSDVIVERVKAAAFKVKRGEAAYERDSVVFDAIEYSWPALAGLLWIAARNRGRLDVLDFGGALGSSYQQNRRFLRGLKVRWNIVEQPRFVECGKQHFEDDELRFYSTIDAAMAEATPQVLLLSSVLQYLEAPYSLLDTIRDRCEFVIVDLTPAAPLPRDRLVVQTVPPSIYPARYPCWIFSETRLQSELQRRFEIVAEFDSNIGQDIRVGRIHARYRGFILARQGTPSMRRAKP